ncbi:tRNA-queuosine alpha-mannosyltransferase domain-containing protein [Aquisalimonas sp. APHAB1-3]|uniref:tRNA-queuosine alpha-mannosyltransferase domain-containing protein n=2 Tax=unclassified Aquisalimonas TaxID=2644645 RepID=UPI003AAF1B3E
MADAFRHIWLLSAYRADSHAAWADWLQRRVHGVHWHVRELPGRHFRWRIRGNPLSWLDELPRQTPDRILATSMVDLATLRGLHPRLAGVPVDYYFHENQFAYPVSPEQVRSVEPQIVQLYGALAADRLLFNSRFNRDSFLDGAADLLRRMPDATPDRVPERLSARSVICPVPVQPLPAAPEKDDALILWNHRWEYDKAPDLFADAMIGLARAGYRFRLALLGARPRTPPEALRRLRTALPERIIADGRVADAAYRELLGRAGIVVSTAAHEFQGLAMLEAASAGAIPLVPDALCYPEQYPGAYRYPAGDVDALQTRLAGWLSGDRPPPVDVSPWLEPAVAPAWQRMMRGDDVESVL